MMLEVNADEKGIGDEVSCLVSAPIMAVGRQSACALCPLQILPWPLVSNTLQAPFLFQKQRT